MPRTLCVPIVLGFLAAAPALPDLISNLSVAASVSGTGSITSDCGSGFVTPPSGCVAVIDGLYLQTLPLSFSGTTSQLGPFGAAGSVTGIYGGSVFANGGGTTLQDYMASNNLVAFLNSSASLTNAGTIISFGVHVTDTVSFAFDLTAETLLEFGGSTPQASNPSSYNTSELIDSHGDVILGGSGPLTLEPGTYTLEDTFDSGFSGGYRQGGGGETASFLASFTAIVPEPRWMSIAPVLLIALGSALSETRRRPV
jgi:hypothetical protein